MYEAPSQAWPGDYTPQDYRILHCRLQACRNFHTYEKGQTEEITAGRWNTRCNTCKSLLLNIDSTFLVPDRQSIIGQPFMVLSLEIVFLMYRYVKTSRCRTFTMAGVYGWSIGIHKTINIIAFQKFLIIFCSQFCMLSLLTTIELTAKFVLIQD